MKRMTPQEITDYKRSWRPGVKVFVHPDVHSRALTWCKMNVDVQQYQVIKWTNVYEHTYHFETEELAIKFIQDAGLEPFLFR